MIKYQASSPYHPQTNGMVERMHAMLNHSITCLAEGIPNGIDPRLPLDPRPPPSTMRPLTDDEYNDYTAEYTARESDILGEHRAAAYHRKIQQAKDDFFFSEGDMVKLKHHGKTNFQIYHLGFYFSTLLFWL